MYDVVILGGGPAGLSAVVYAQRAMLSAVVCEKTYLGAGQITESDNVDNYLGFPNENGYDLGNKFRLHAEKTGAKFIYKNVKRIMPTKSGYKVVLEDENVLETKTIIYALGTERKKLGVDGEYKFIGKGVSYCAICDAAFYRNKIAAVVGGGDTALNDAVLLSAFAEKVYLIHRRNTFRANKKLQSKVKEISNIEIIMNAEVRKILGEKSVSDIEISQNEKTSRVSLNGVFIAIGSTPNSGLLKEIAELDKNGYVAADETGVTSAKGIFAAGDVRSKPLRQVVTAVSDGANCVYSVQDYLSL